MISMYHQQGFDEDEYFGKQRGTMDNLGERVYIDDEMELTLLETWLKERVIRLEALLDESRKCIRSVEDKSVFGIGGEGMTHWYLADELLTNIDKALGDWETGDYNHAENKD